MAAPTEAMAQLALKTTPAAPKLAKGKKGTARKVVTNSFPVSIRPNTAYYLHDCRIYAVYKRNGEEKMKEITKKTREDSTELERKNAAVEAFKAMRNNKRMPEGFFYDRAAILIGTREIPECKGGAEYKLVLTPQNAVDLFRLTSVREAEEVRIVIKKAADTYQVISEDLQSRDDAIQKAILAVINLSTSQGIFENKDFNVYGNGNAFFHPDAAAVGFANFDVGTADKIGVCGLTKGAKIVEGEGGRMAAAITVDAKKTAMHKEMFVSQKLVHCGTAEHPFEATQVVQGLKATVEYAGAPNMSGRPITIGQVSNTRVRDVAFTDDKGRRTTLPTFVQNKKNTRLQNPNSFAVIDKFENNFYAPETLKIAPGQRVKSENLQPAVTEKLIRESAIPPAKRQAETAILAKALKIGADNPAQVARGTTVNTSTPIVVDARVQDPIKLGTGGLPISVCGTWRQGKVAQTPLASFDRWTVIHIHDGREEQSMAATTAQCLTRYAANNGWTIPSRVSFVIEQNEPRNMDKQLKTIIEREKAAGSRYFLLISNKAIKNHIAAKMLEIRNDVVVQQITSFVARKLPEQANTGSNIVLKIVEKLGGQNHFVSRTTVDLPPWLTQKGTLICAIQMQHPSSMTGKEREANTYPSRPVCIGWSLNAVRGAQQRAGAEGDAQIEKEATHFSADWGYALPKDYQEGRDFRVAYKEVAVTILRSFKNLRGPIPMRIILLRGGVPEGDYEKIRREEVPIWQEAFKQMNANFCPNFVIVTVNEMHSDRFYQTNIPANERAPRQNLPPGTTISSGVTNPAYSSAFIQSHQPLQGTAKVPLYVVQHTQFNPKQPLAINMDDIERMVYALAYSHGTCNTPTAVPTPLYVARDSMRRASELFAYHQKQKSNARDWTIDEIREALTIKPESDISGLRINA